VPRWSVVHEFHDSAKGIEYLQAFVDPGPPFDPAVGPPDVWFRRVVDHLAEVVIALRHDGEVVYASAAATLLLGRSPESLIGTNALDLLHPDDLAVAAETVYHAGEVQGYRPARPFRLLHASGESFTFEVEGLSLFHVPDVQSIVVVCRFADDAARVDNIIGLLAAQSPIAPIVEQLVYLMKRPGWRLGVAIQYDDGSGDLRVAHTDLPPALTEFAPESDTPWTRARLADAPCYDIGLSMVSPGVAQAARACGYESCWAVPVSDPLGAAAVVVVWNHELVEPELGQAALLNKLTDLLSLALVGRARSSELERAASTDALSSLSNRRRFDAELHANQRDDVAVLVIDLDGFKAVNDQFGHAAGDDVIRVVGSRIAQEIRRDDIAARIGGDEFAILCRGVVDVAEAEGLAERLLASVPDVIDIGGTCVEIGLSIGIAVAADAQRPDPLGLIELADRMLYEAKRRGKGRYRVARLPLRTA